MDAQTQVSSVASPFDRIVGRKIRFQRLEKAMTQKALARKLGVSFQQVQKYESGSNKLSAERLWALSQVFSVPMQYWADKTDPADAMITRADAFIPSASTAGQRRAIALMRSYSVIADEAVQMALLALVRAIARE